MQKNRYHALAVEASILVLFFLWLIAVAFLLSENEILEAAEDSSLLEESCFLQGVMVGESGSYLFEWDFDSRELIYSDSLPPEEVFSLDWQGEEQFFSDDEAVAVGMREGVLRKWEASGKLLVESDFFSGVVEERDFDENIEALAWDEESEGLYLATGDGLWLVSQEGGVESVCQEVNLGDIGALDMKDGSLYGASVIDPEVDFSVGVGPWARKFFYNSRREGALLPQLVIRYKKTKDREPERVLSESVSADLSGFLSDNQGKSNQGQGYEVGEVTLQIVSFDDFVNQDGQGIDVYGQADTLWIGTASRPEDSYLGLRFHMPEGEVLEGDVQVLGAYLELFNERDLEGGGRGCPDNDGQRYPCQWGRAAFTVFADRLQSPAAFGEGFLPRQLDRRGQLTQSFEVYDRGEKWFAYRGENDIWRIDVKSVIEEVMADGLSRESISLIARGGVSGQSRSNFQNPQASFWQLQVESCQVQQNIVRSVGGRVSSVACMQEVGRGDLWGRLWIDQNGSGLFEQDEDGGREGVVVKAIFEGVFYETATLDDGSFIFEDLPFGEYELVWEGGQSGEIIRSDVAFDGHNYSYRVILKEDESFGVDSQELSFGWQIVEERREVDWEAVDRIVSVEEDTMLIIDYLPMELVERNLGVDQSLIEWTVGRSVSEYGGVVSVLSDGRIEYWPLVNFVGTDFFWYEVCFKQECAKGRVEVVVLPVNDFPVIQDDRWLLMSEVGFLDVLVNDYDVDGSLDLSSLQIVDHSFGEEVEVFVVGGEGVIVVSLRDGLFLNQRDFWILYRICDDQGSCGEAKVYLDWSIQKTTFGDVFFSNWIVDYWLKRIRSLNDPFSLVVVEDVFELSGVEEVSEFDFALLRLASVVGGGIFLFLLWWLLPLNPMGLYLGSSDMEARDRINLVKKLGGSYYACHDIGMDELNE